MADLSWRTGSILSCCKGLWDCRVLKPITTKQLSVFWLVNQSRHMSAIYVGIWRWNHLRRLVLPVIPPYWHSNHVSAQCRGPEGCDRQFVFTLSLSGAILLAVALHRSFTNSPYLCAMLPRAPSGLDLHSTFSINSIDTHT